MEILFSLFKFVHYFVCAGLIVIVLLQAGKSGGMAGIFGGGGADQIFSAPSGKSFLKKITIVMACLFLFTSIFLTKVSSKMTASSVMNRAVQNPAVANVAEQQQDKK